MALDKFTDKAEWHAVGARRPKMPIGRVLLGLVAAAGIYATLSGGSTLQTMSGNIDVSFMNHIGAQATDPMFIEVKGPSMASQFAVAPIPSGAVAKPVRVAHAAGQLTPPKSMDTTGALAAKLAAQLNADFQEVPAAPVRTTAQAPARTPSIPVLPRAPQAASGQAVPGDLTHEPVVAELVLQPAPPTSPALLNGVLSARKSVLGDAGFAAQTGGEAPPSRLGVAYTYLPNLHTHVNGIGDEEIIEGGFVARYQGDQIGDPSDAFMNVAVLTYMQNTGAAYSKAVATLETAQAEARRCAESVRDIGRCVSSAGGVKFDYGKRAFSASLLKDFDGQRRAPSQLMVAIETQSKMVALAQFARVTTPDYEIEDPNAADQHAPAPSN